MANEIETVDGKRRTKKEVIRLVAAGVFLIISLVGLHYEVQYTGWGIFIAVILVLSVA